MNKEVESIIKTLQNVNTGEPWYGRAVYEILDETDPAKAAVKPNKSGHSLLELIYHMLTWSEFTLKSIEFDKGTDTRIIEKLDWRDIDPGIHTWEKGLAAFKSTQDKIITLLGQKTDEFLEEIVTHHKYNVRFLLNGLVQHNIYHLGQVAYINKLLV
jgi:uncharacterized damage-inducible protein DinB